MKTEQIQWKWEQNKHKEQNIARTTQPLDCPKELRSLVVLAGVKAP